jgi:hypothetical protein
MSPQIADSGRNTVFPYHGVSRADTSNCNTARTGNADDLAFVIDCCSSAGAVTRQWQQLLHFAVSFPDYCPELQDLESRITGWVVDAVLSPADYLAAVVGAGCIAVITAGKRRQGRHCAAFPTKAFAYFPGRITSREEGVARKQFAQRIVVIGIRNTYDQSIVTLDRPSRGTVGSRPPERAEIDWR